jgi:hypothetical protein
MQLKEQEDQPSYPQQMFVVCSLEVCDWVYDEYICGKIFHLLIIDLLFVPYLVQSVKESKQSLTLWIHAMQQGDSFELSIISPLYLFSLSTAFSPKAKRCDSESLNLLSVFINWIEKSSK